MELICQSLLLKSLELSKILSLRFNLKLIQQEAAAQTLLLSTSARVQEASALSMGST